MIEYKVEVVIAICRLVEHRTSGCARPRDWQNLGTAGDLTLRIHQEIRKTHTIQAGVEDLTHKGSLCYVERLSGKGIFPSSLDCFYRTLASFGNLPRSDLRLCRGCLSCAVNLYLLTLRVCSLTLRLWHGLGWFKEGQEQSRRGWARHITGVYKTEVQL